MAAVLFILGILCLGYYIFLRSLGMDFSIIWLAMGVGLLFAGYLLGWEPAWVSLLPKGVKAGGCVLLALGILLFAALELLIISGMGGQPEAGLDYIIVLGAQVRGERPSRALRRRIEAAGCYLRDNPSTIAILSGGQGPGEDMTEAGCMRRELVGMGIEGKRLLMETRSTSTWENLEFSAQLAPARQCRTGLVTQNFHVYRSLKLARHQHYGQVYGIPAPSEWMYQPHFMVREAFALAKEKLVGKL